jgi:hypothetical protein
MATYFTTDGSYGHADYLTIIDTTNWADDDWVTIDNCSDNERLQLAEKIQKERETTQ